MVDFGTLVVLDSAGLEMVLRVVEEEGEGEGEEKGTVMVVSVEIHIELVVVHNLVDFEAHNLEDSDSAVVRIHVNCSSEEQCMLEESVTFQDVMKAKMNKWVVVVVSKDRDNSHLTASKASELAEEEPVGVVLIHNSGLIDLNPLLIVLVLVSVFPPE